MTRSQVLLDQTVVALERALGSDLISVVLYGPEAHGEQYASISQLNVMIVLENVEPSTLGRLGPPLRKWLRGRQSWPRIFTPAAIEQSTDVFPIEFLDIVRHHRVLYGKEVLADLNVSCTNLRIQCERELREKMMRLREAYIECDGRETALRDVLVTSFASFAFVFRGCLHLLGAPVPTRNAEVAAAFCQRMGLQASPFEAIEALARGSSVNASLEKLFAAYYEALTQIVERIDRFDIQGESP